MLVSIVLTALLAIAPVLSAPLSEPRKPTTYISTNGSPKVAPKVNALAIGGIPKVASKIPAITAPKVIDKTSRPYTTVKLTTGRTSSDNVKVQTGGRKGFFAHLREGRKHTSNIIRRPRPKHGGKKHHSVKSPSGRRGHHGESRTGKNRWSSSSHSKGGMSHIKHIKASNYPKDASSRLRSRPNKSGFPAGKGKGYALPGSNSGKKVVATGKASKPATKGKV